MSEFNLPLLRKAVEWAESEARKPEVECEWYQGHFMVPGYEIDRTCGTAYCIAGHVASDAGMWPENGGVDEVAMDLLGIKFEDAWCDEYGLFCSWNDIEDVRRIAEQIARKYGEEL